MIDIDIEYRDWNRQWSCDSAVSEANPGFRAYVATHQNRGVKRSLPDLNSREEPGSSGSDWTNSLEKANLDKVNHKSAMTNIIRCPFMVTPVLHVFIFDFNWTRCRPPDKNLCVLLDRRATKRNDLSAYFNKINHSLFVRILPLYSMAIQITMCRFWIEQLLCVKDCFSEVYGYSF